MKTTTLRIELLGSWGARHAGNYVASRIELYEQDLDILKYKEGLSNKQLHGTALYREYEQFRNEYTV